MNLLPPDLKTKVDRIVWFALDPPASRTASFDPRTEAADEKAEAAATAALEERRQPIVLVDLREHLSINSARMSRIVRVHNAAKARGGETIILVDETDPAVADVLRIARLDMIMDMRPMA